MGNSFWCYVRIVLSVHYSCAVVSVFWLWREIVLKMRTRFYTKSYWVTLLWSACFSKTSRPFCVSRNWWIIVLFLQSNSLRITILSQKYWDLLQPYSHDRFSKISRTFYASRKLWIIVVFLQCRKKEKLPIFLINTLLLCIPLLALTDRQNHRETNTLAARGLEELFSSCAVVSVFGSGGK